MGFLVQLPTYRGPLDLLLYLVRRQELGLNELSVAKVVDQYIEYIDLLQALDLADVADFLDVASILVELKSHSVFPSIEMEEEDGPSLADEEPNQLIDRLLEYKRMRDAADILEEMGQRWQQRYFRTCEDLPPRQVDPGSQPIADLQLWDLVSNFGRITREFSGPTTTEVIYDETPIHVYMSRIHARLKTEPQVLLIDLLRPKAHKSALIGWFLAVLELCRHHGAIANQDENGEIVLTRGPSFDKVLNLQEINNFDKNLTGTDNMRMR